MGYAWAPGATCPMHSRTRASQEETLVPRELERFEREAHAPFTAAEDLVPGLRAVGRHAASPRRGR